MRTLRLYARDLRVGLPSVRPYLVAALVLGIVYGIAAAGDCAYSGNDLSSFTFADYVALTFQFANPVDLWLLIQGRPLTITFPWFFSFAVLFAATLEYPRADRATIVLTDDGHREIVECSEEAYALAYEAADLERAVAGCEEERKLITYASDVMDVMTRLRYDWGVYYPEEAEVAAAAGATVAGA